MKQGWLMFSWLDKFYRACNRVRLKVNICKGEVLKFKEGQKMSREKVRVNGEKMEDVDKFRYLEVISANGGLGKKWPIGN